MRNVKKITLGENLEFDFSKSESAIEYLVYITNKVNYRLIVQNVILLEHKDAVKEFYNRTNPINYKRIFFLCLLSTIPIHDIFIRKNLTFILEDYFLDDSISELKRRNKLNQLVNNFDEILNYISYQIGIKEFKILDDTEAEDLAVKFYKKYKSVDFYHKENEFTYDYPIRIPLLTHNLMLYCIAYRFTFFNSKLLKDFSSFLNISDQKKQDSIEKTIQNTTVHCQDNLFPRIFSDYKSFNFYEKLSNEICKKEKTKLADYSFVFRRLQLDGFVYQDISEKTFREFLSNEYQIHLDKLKTLEYSSTDSKETIYKMLRP
jgi:hypothetical protein